jgi:hypothetical protein
MSQEQAVAAAISFCQEGEKCMVRRATTEEYKLFFQIADEYVEKGTLPPAPTTITIDGEVIPMSGQVDVTTITTTGTKQPSRQSRKVLARKVLNFRQLQKQILL